MPPPSSADLRERVVQAYNEGGSTYEEVAARFCVCRASVDRWLRLAREQGHPTPKPHGGGKPPLLQEADVLYLQELVAQRPSATLAELAQDLSSHKGVSVAISVVHRALRRLNITKKKPRFMPRNANNQG